MRLAVEGRDEEQVHAVGEEIKKSIRVLDTTGREIPKVIGAKRGGTGRQFPKLVGAVGKTKDWL